jgi:ABC-type multidrug transport system permease subunit
METTLKSSTVNLATNRTKQVSNSWYANLISKLEFSYFGLIAMTITIGSILGGLSAMQILSQDAPIWQLGLVMAGAMANNVSAIGQAPTKWVVNLFTLSSLISILFILTNL